MRFASMLPVGTGGMPALLIWIQHQVEGECYMINRQSHLFCCNQRIIVHISVKLHSASPHAITRLLLAQLFFNCTQISVTTYTNSTVTFGIGI